MSYEYKDYFKRLHINETRKIGTDLNDKFKALDELNEVYAQAAEYKEYRADTEKLYNALKAKGEKEILKYKVIADEYEVKAKSFDYARGKLITKIQNLRDRADRADDIEVENELRERLSKFEEVDNNLMAAFVKASFGQKTKEERSSENKGGESLRAKLREKTANALDNKIENEIKKGSERLWD